MTTMLPLTALTADPDLQVRAASSESLISEYADRMRAGTTFPAVFVFFDGTTYHLADGNHRCEAARRVGRATILADVVPGTKAEALWEALGANRTNGLRLTKVDMRHCIKLAIAAWPERSNALIADQVGCSASYVGSIKAGVATTVDLPDRVAGRDGVLYPASPAAAAKARETAAQMLRDGRSAADVRAALKMGRDTIHEIQRGLGLVMDKTRSGLAARRQRMRDLAANGHSSRQIAADIGMTEEGCRASLKQLGIVVPGDRVMRGTHRHNSTRIVGRIVMDAENLTEGVRLIDFGDLDQAQMGDWIVSLLQSRKNLSTFIRRLQESQHGEAQSHPVEDPTGSDRADADAPGVGDPATVSPGSR